ncbi:hypothetical protein [Dermabacter hominis]
MDVILPMLELGRVRLRDLAGFSVFDGGSRILRVIRANADPERKRA